MPVLFDAANIADAPVRSSRGPAISPPSRWVDGKDAKLGAWAYSAGQPIAGAELLYDASAKPGSGIPLVASDGAFDSEGEGVELDLGRRRGPKDGLVYVRAQHADGTWGALSAGWMRNPNPPAPGYAPGVTPET